LYMGWLFRCFEKPKQFIPRYIKAFKLAGLMIRYRLSNKYKYKYEYELNYESRA